MRLLVFGDRNWSNRILVFKRIRELAPEVVIEGEATGADTLARYAAVSLGIPVLKFPAEWDKYGKAAGPIRNQQMLEEGKPTYAVGFHNDIENSKGSKDMQKRLLRAGVPHEIVKEEAIAT